MTIEEICLQAILHYGAGYQLRKVQEECAEFIVAAMHYEQGRVSAGPVIEELADLIIMTTQARLIFGPQLVDEAVDKKLTRLRERMAA